MRLTIIKGGNNHVIHVLQRGSNFKPTEIVMSEEADDKELISVGYSSSLPTDEAAVSDAVPTTGKALESSSTVSLFTECRMMKYRNKFFEVNKVIILCTVTKCLIMCGREWGIIFLFIIMINNNCSIILIIN